MPKVLNAHDFKGRPPGAIYIGRYHPRFGSSKWRNCFEMRDQNDDIERAEVIAKYRAWICDQPKLLAALPELEGHDLICWCAPKPCHGDVLLELLASRSREKPSLSTSPKSGGSDARTGQP
jgi:hypothetical protein